MTPRVGRARRRPPRRASARRLWQLVRIVVRGTLPRRSTRTIPTSPVPRALPCRRRKLWRLCAQIVSSNCADLPLLPPVSASNASVPLGLFTALGCAIAIVSAPSMLGAVYSIRRGRGRRRAPRRRLGGGGTDGHLWPSFRAERGGGGLPCATGPARFLTPCR